MTEQFLCRECPDHLRALLPRLWDRERAALERLLVKIPTDQRTLRVTLTHEPIQNVARVILSLPTGKLVAEGVEKSAERALHQAAARLIRQVKQHLAQLRREADYRK
jgi:ribosome-associated translation inhibitor RaiA